MNDMGRPTTIEIGRKFGTLEVIGIAPVGKAGFHSKAICKCTCGNITNIQSHLLKKTKSCGCLRYDKNTIKQRSPDSYSKKPSGVAAANSFYYSLKTNANRRNIVFDLSQEQTLAVATQDCFYCGEKPKEWNVLRKDKRQMYNGSIFINGLDRVDNSKGYTPENIVACCKLCNLMKHTNTQADFYNHVLKIASRLLNSEELLTKAKTPTIAEACGWTK